MTQEEKIKPSLQEEITHLKRVVAGQKGRMQQMVAELQGFDSIIKAKKGTIAGLESQVKEMSETLRKQANRIEELKGELSVSEANLEYYKSLPWWKKLFT